VRQEGGRGVDLARLDCASLVYTLLSRFLRRGKGADGGGCGVRSGERHLALRQ
jgi:hypothetical protein